jgi:WD40 repeat protein
VVGNAQGEMAQFDIKRLSSASIVHKYNGVIGSIRSIDTHPTLPLIASASIDQYVRIHDAETYRQVAKVRSLQPCIVLISFFFSAVLSEISSDVGSVLPA